ncbi:MAG TPA: biopolymer transporter ExbD [Terriglobales bacterium]|nr:biopolymer transporter ExbD [Terriglobales bacterium]
MLKRMKRRIGVKIDMTPMVDIAFLLLIFYMTTTQFKPPEKKSVTLPASHSQIKLPEKDILNITVTKDDSIAVDYVDRKQIEVQGKSQQVLDRVYEDVNLSTLPGAILQIRAKYPGIFVVIKADREAHYGTIQALMNTMRDNHMPRFQLVTEIEAGS